MLRKITSMRKNLLAWSIIAGNRNTSRGQEKQQSERARKISKVRGSERVGVRGRKQT